MIKRNYIKPQTVEIFNPQGDSLGYFNEYEYNDFRLQIVINKATGYWLSYNGQVYEIDKYGMIDNHPKGLFDTLCELHSRIINIRCGIN